MSRAVLLAAFTLLTTSAALAEEIDSRKYGWRDDYAAARTEARRAGKPLMVVFRCER